MRCWLRPAAMNDGHESDCWRAHESAAYQQPHHQRLEKGPQPAKSAEMAVASATDITSGSAGVEKKLASSSLEQRHDFRLR